VLGHSAIETAEILESTVPAVNRALQRARATLDETPTAKRPTEEAEQAMLTRYLEAWTRSDIRALVSTLRDDASLVMPPMAQWFVGARNIGTFFSQPFLLAPQADAARFKAVATRAAGCPAIALFRRAAPDAPWAPDSLHVLELRGDRIGRIAAWVTPALHAKFGVDQPPG
jgi:RNA polymerase sigma-70 factor (ECF subfamily)